MSHVKKVIAFLDVITFAKATQAKISVLKELTQLTKDKNL